MIKFTYVYLRLVAESTADKKWNKGRAVEVQKPRPAIRVLPCSVDEVKHVTANLSMAILAVAYSCNRKIVFRLFSRECGPYRECKDIWF